MNQPAYCILRAEKLTSFGSITGSAMHTFREIPTPNADPERTHLNWTGGAKSAAEVRAAIKARLPEKRRKDAVLCIEYLITASPEWCKATPWKTQREYFNAAIAWLRERHGRENVVCLNLQRDETSPHLVAYVVPLTKDGRLSAKDFLGGRKVLSQMQTDFAEKIGKPVGLQRGVEGSKATHTTAKQYAAALQKNPTLAAPVPPAPTIADRVTGRAKQAAEEYTAAQAEYAAMVERTLNVVMVGRHARAQQAAAIEELRQEVEEAKQHELEADRLRKENERLRAREKAREQEFASEKRSFMETIANLKGQLQEAVTKIKRMAARILFLEDKLFPARQNRHTVDDVDGDSGLTFRP